MLDIRLLRLFPKQMERELQRRDPDLSLKLLFRHDANLRKATTRLGELRNQKKELAEKIQMMKKEEQEAPSLRARAELLRKHIAHISEKLYRYERRRDHYLLSLPNLPAEDLPGKTICLRSWGEPKTSPKYSHLELPLLDLARGASMSGSGWPVYKEEGAKLEWALLSYMLDKQMRKGYRLWQLPHLVKKETLMRAGQLPKFADQVFSLDKDELFLIPTAEVPLLGLHAGEVLPLKGLPIRYCSYTPCFRREAGAAGSHTRGLIRTHQFNKVELFAFATAEQSGGIFEEMIAAGEEILRELNLPYRVMSLTADELPFTACRSVDLEVWIPGQKCFYEVSSISYCGDFQGRRAKVRTSIAGKTQYLHTLNASGLATSRLLVAILETHQKEDGTIDTPEVLRPYILGN